MIDFVQLNMKKSYLAAVELGKNTGGNRNSLICMVTEPYRKEGKVCSIPKGFRCISSKENARAAIFWSRDLNVYKVDALSNQDCAVGLTRIDRLNVLIVSVYLDINLPTIPCWLQRIVSYSNKKKYPIIFGVDTNAHSVLFGPVSYTHLTLPTIYSV